MKPLFLLAACATIVAAQAIDGDLVNAVTGAPVAGARVSIQTAGSPDRHFAVSDATGHFHLAVSGPMYGPVTVVHPDFLGNYASDYRPGQPLPSSIRIELTPQAVITGKLEDEDGFPVENAMVQALRYTIVDGRRKLQTASMFGQTNDLGEFHLAGLSAGRYYLCASSSNLSNWDRRYSGECHPGTLDPKNAKAIEVKAGQEVHVPFRLTRRQGVTVSGHVLLPSNSQIARMPFLVLQSSEQYNFGASPITSLQRDGSFTIRHVQPGSYTLKANSGQFRPGDLYGEQKIQVGDSDLRDIVLAPHEVQAVDLTGKVVADDGSSPAALTIGLRPTTGQTIAATSSEDGAFELKGLLPGHYDLMVTVPFTGVPSRRVSRPVSARLREQEVLQGGFDLDGTPAGPLQITVSANIALIMGRISDGAGHAVANAVVLLLGSTGRFLMSSDTGGRFGSASLRPGDYRVYAVADDTQFALLDDPDYLKAHQGDYPPVHLVADENPMLTIRLK